MPSTTRFVESSEDYQRPPSTESRLLEKLRRMPRTDHNGYDVPPGAPDPSITPIVSAPPVTMVTALLSAAAVAGVDAGALVDSASFMRDIGAISPSDSAGLLAAIGAAVAANPSLGAVAPVVPGMQPNRAQGASSTGGTLPAAAPSTTAERLRAETAKAFQ
jgi:hypothetical protein